MEEIDYSYLEGVTISAQGEKFDVSNARRIEIGDEVRRDIDKEELDKVDWTDSAPVIGGKYDSGAVSIRGRLNGEEVEIVL
jgi:hypothetical protein